MKCPNCGGNIPSGSLACPYCGTANQEEIAFQEEIQKKIERNKLLKPFLIKQKTPELVQKMLTRILLILTGINVLLLVISFAFYMWGERKQDYKSPEEGSKAKAFYDTFIEMDNYNYASFLKEAGDIIEMVQNGEVPTPDDVEYVIRYGFEALEDSQKHAQTQSEEIQLTVDAFFMGYIGLSEEEMKVFRPGEDGNYDYWIDDEQLQKTKEIVADKLQEVMK